MLLEQRKTRFFPILSSTYACSFCNTPQGGDRVSEQREEPAGTRCRTNEGWEAKQRAMWLGEKSSAFTCSVVLLAHSASQSCYCNHCISLCVRDMCWHSMFVEGWRFMDNCSLSALGCLNELYIVVKILCNKRVKVYCWPYVKYKLKGAVLSTADLGNCIYSSHRLSFCHPWPALLNKNTSISSQTCALVVWLDHQPWYYCSHGTSVQR